MGKGEVKCFTKLADGTSLESSKPCSCNETKEVGEVKKQEE